MESHEETTGLRSFATIAFVVLLVIGIVSVIAGVAVMVLGLADAGVTAILSGAVCVVAGFGLRLILRVFANMADDTQAARELLERIAEQPAAPSASQAPPSTSTTPTTPAAPKKTRLPMPPPKGSGGAKPRIPMPPLRGSLDK